MLPEIDLFRLIVIDTGDTKFIFWLLALQPEGRGMLLVLVLVVLVGETSEVFCRFICLDKGIFYIS